MNILKVLKTIKMYIDRRKPIEYAKKIGVRVGENTRFTDNPSFGSEPYLISIGNHCLISSQVAFITHDGATWVFREEGKYKDTYKFGKITVGNNCFIGFRSTILPGVEIGDNSIIAAGSIVNKSVPPGEVWGGVPARFIMKTEDFAMKCYEKRLPYDADRLRNDKKSEMLRVLDNVTKWDGLIKNGKKRANWYVR